MRVFRQILLLSALAISAGTIVSCSSTPDVTIDPTADVTVELRSQHAALDEARQEQLDVIAPQHFHKADMALRSADSSNNEREKEQTLRQIAVSKAHLDRAREVLNRKDSSLDALLESRTAALKANANTYLPTEMGKADDEFRDEIGEDLEENKFRADAKEISQLQDRYLNLELKAIKQANLGGAYELRRKNERLKASSVTPLTYQETQADIATAEKTIDTDRHNSEKVKAASDRANASARKLDGVLAMTKGAGGREAEALAIQSWNQQEANRATSDRLSKTQDQLNTQGRQLTSAENANAELSRQAIIQAKINSLQNAFGKNEAEVSQQGDHVIFRLKTIQFPSNRNELSANALSTLGKVKTAMSELQPTEVTVEGHTDSIGSAELNKGLSEKRAEAVKKYLVDEKVVSSDEIEAVGYGFEKPLTTNKTKNGRAQNRRVDIVVTPSQNL